MLILMSCNITCIIPFISTVKSSVGNLAMMIAPEIGAKSEQIIAQLASGTHLNFYVYPP